MDVQMPVMDGIEATRRIVADDLARVVILTTFDRDDYVFAGLAAGASGFLLKNADADHLIEAVRAVSGGHALLAPEVTRRVIEQMTSGPVTGAGAGPRPVDRDARLDDLTPREPGGARSRGPRAVQRRDRRPALRRRGDGQDAPVQRLRQACTCATGCRRSCWRTRPGSSSRGTPRINRTGDPPTDGRGLAWVA